MKSSKGKVIYTLASELINKLLEEGFDEEILLLLKNYR